MLCGFAVLSKDRSPLSTLLEKGVPVNVNLEPGSNAVATINSSSESWFHASCTSLQVIDALCAHNKGYRASRVATLDTWNSAATATCQVCQFFSAVKGSSRTLDGTRAYSLFVHWASASQIWGRDGSVLVVASDGFNETLNNAIEKNGAIACVEATGNSRCVAGRRIDHKSIDFDLVRQWRRLCNQHHERCNRYRETSVKPKNIKLIDCVTRQLIRAQSHHQYVALSYVWGEDAASDTITTENRLPDLLPQTIEDAISVARCLQPLDHQYLWIDRYCIDQTNEMEKNEQIRQMDTIYRNADITLVAAAGNDPSYGLPGVSKRHRKPQPNASLGGVEFVSIFPHPEETVKKSRWSQRAWTYQEGYFSLKRLMFLDDQIYFSCRSGAAAETIQHLNHNATSNYTKDRDNKDQEADRVLDHLSQYSGRQLTRDHDAVNAIAGIFNDYSSFRKGATAHYHGIPIPLYSVFNKFTEHKPGARSGDQERRMTDAFLIGLSWQNREPGQRRNIWPSWTWAEWKVPFGYGSHGIYKEVGGGGFALGTDFVTKPRVAIEALDSALLDFEDENTLALIKDSSTHLSKFIWIESWTFDFKVRMIDRDDPPNFSGSRTTAINGELFEGSYVTAGRCNLVLKGEEADLQVSFWPLDLSHRHHSYPDHQRTEEVLGIMLSKHEIEKHGDKDRKRYSFNLMVVKKTKMDYYERIGHCCIHSDQLRDLAQQCGSLEDDWMFGWPNCRVSTSRLTERYLHRRAIRIG